MTLKERLKEARTLAQELEYYRGLLKKQFEEMRAAGLDEDEDGERYLNSEPFKAWWARSQRWAAELDYLQGLLETGGVSGRHRQVIRLRYYEGLSWEDVARRMHYAESHVRRLHEVAIRDMEEAQRWEQMDIDDAEGA